MAHASRRPQMSNRISGYGESFLCYRLQEFKNRYVKNALSCELFHIPTCQKIPDDLRSNVDLAISAFPRSQGVGAVPNVFSTRKVFIFLLAIKRYIAVSTMSHKFSHVTDHYSTLLSYLHQWVKKHWQRLIFPTWAALGDSRTSADVVRSIRTM